MEAGRRGSAGVCCCCCWREYRFEGENAEDANDRSFACEVAAAAEAGTSPGGSVLAGVAWRISSAPGGCREESARVGFGTGELSDFDARRIAAEEGVTGIVAAAAAETPAPPRGVEGTLDTSDGWKGGREGVSKLRLVLLSAPLAARSGRIAALVAVRR